MISKTKISVIVTTILLSIFSVSFVRSADEIRVYTKLEYVNEYDINRVRKEAQKAVNIISSTLEVKRKRKINIKIVDSGICRVTPEGVVLLPIKHVQRKKAAIIHEITHLMAKHKHNRFFCEGLAIYFQEKYGEDNGFPNFAGVPLDDLVRDYQGLLMPIYMLSKNNDIFRQVGTEKRKIAYIEAGSFTNFLVEVYGESKLKALHNSWNLNYKKIYGKDLKGLENEWKEFVLKGM